MPLRLDIKKKLSARSDRVKCVEFHPTEAWTLAALYSGNLFIWDYNTQTLVKSMEVCGLPVRCAKFITRKQWVVTASDDMQIRVFNYNSLEKVHVFDAHADYIRHLAVHPSCPYLLSSSDDMTIKMWNWEKNWSNPQVFDGHSHYVMMCQWNPKDTNIFASCSLDKTVKVWGITGSTAHFTLTGHQKGINCVEYSPTGEKPYLISGSDDKTVKIWDYQSKQCVQTLSGHTNNCSAALFHPVLPIIITGSEDGTVRIWHAATFRLETTLNYLLERVWYISCLKDSNLMTIGYDEGTVVIKLGSEEPVVSMTPAGKIVWAKGNDIQTANLKLVEARNGERLPLSVRDMGSSEIYPQFIAHHPNGRLFVVCGDGEYVIYTAQAFRNKSFGQAVEFVWGHDGAYATRNSQGKISVFHNFQEAFSFKLSFPVEEMFGGRLIGVRGGDYVCFYDWSEYRLIRRIEVCPKQIVWSEDGSQVVLMCADNFYILAHDKDAVQAVIASGAAIDEEGIDVAFDCTSEINDKVSSGVWVGECFVYVTHSQHLVCLVAGQTENLAHLDRPQYLLGYIKDHSNLYLIDKNLDVTPYTLHLALVEYQGAIIRKDFDAAHEFFDQLPESLHNRIGRFLENQGYPAEALQVSKDEEHRFELALQLGRLNMAADIIHSIAQQANPVVPPKSKWKTLGDVALEQGDFALARRCFTEAKDLSGLFLLCTSCGDFNGVKETSEMAEGRGIANIAVLGYTILGDAKSALQVLCNVGRFPEAAFFARTYCPSELPNIVAQWRTDLQQVNKALSESLADPKQYPDLFPNYELTVTAEKLFQERARTHIPASMYVQERDLLGLDVLEDLKNLGVDAFKQKILHTCAPLDPPKEPLNAINQDETIGSDEIRSDENLI